MSLKRIVVGISGGIDSAVSVALLKKTGYEVYGYTFLSSEVQEKNNRIKAESAEVARAFDIPHIVEDISGEFSGSVVEYFVDGYRNGRTPNPCVYCNRYLKIPRIMACSQKLGIDMIATGHYVRNINGFLHCGADRTKDQSYFLGMIDKEWLPNILFPLGDYTKSEVRKIGNDLGLEAAKAKDSQEICFVPDDDYRGFLKQHGMGKESPGDFVDSYGRVLGTHRGISCYTIGQRRGLGIALGRPVFVRSINIAKNQVVLGDEKDLYSSGCILKDCNLFTDIRENTQYMIKIRYRSEAVPCMVEGEGGNNLTISFAEPQKAVTPGQFGVIYDNDAVVAAGEIGTVIKNSVK